jgi:hypothetical protein
MHFVEDVVAIFWVAFVIGHRFWSRDLQNVKKVILHGLQ